MRRTKPDLTFIFINPNTPKQVHQLLKQIMIEKLLALPIDTAAAVD